MCEDAENLIICSSKYRQEFQRTTENQCGMLVIFEPSGSPALKT